MVLDKQVLVMQFKDKPKVAVFMVTYNHASFIEQAIEGVMMQQTNFPFKLFIGEDCSTDSTRKICLRYKEKYPDRIELLLNEKNIGGVANALRVYPACFAYGDYTAMCEGDDYWTDTLKLQKQVDFLEANPDFAICFHHTKVVYEDESREPFLFNSKQKEVTTFEDLARGNYIQTVSCVYRNGLFGEFPDWFHTLKLGDWILHLLNAQHGKIKFIDDVMAVYRVHKGGAWGLTDWKITYAYAIEAIEICKKHFAPRGKKQFNHFLCTHSMKLSYEYFNEGSFDNCRKYYRKGLKTLESITFRAFIHLTLRYFLSYFPPLAVSYKLNLRKLKGI